MSPGDTITMDRSGLSFEFEFLYASGDGFVAHLDQTTGGFTAGNYWFSDTAHANSTTAPNDGNSYYLCFLEGTLIATPSGDVPVETLRIGDPVVTHDGRVVPVRWLGRRQVFPRFADPLRAFPIRICQHALGENMPCRDLYLSPGHALLVDGILVSAGALVNGSTITRVTAPAAAFTYWHVETADHALIVAEGAPAETFIDNVTRRRFDNHADYAAMYGEERSTIVEIDLPRVMSARQVPPAIRARLADRAHMLGLTLRQAA